MDVISKNRHFLCILNSHGLTTLDQSIIFTYLVENHISGKTTSLNVLQQQVEMKKSSFFRLIKKMELEMGLLETETNFEDLRNKNVKLTQEALLIIEELYQNHCLENLKIA